MWAELALVGPLILGEVAMMTTVEPQHPDDGSDDDETCPPHFNEPTSYEPDDEDDE